MPVLSDCLILLDGYNRSGDTNQAAVARETEALSDDDFAAGLDAKFEPGMRKGQIEVEGRFAAATADSIDEQLFDGVSIASQVITVSAQGGADGEQADFGTIIQGSYGLETVVGQIGPFSMSAAVDGLFGHGKIMHPNTARASSGNGTARQLGAVASGGNVAASLHVLDATGATLDVIIQHDDNSGMTSPTSGITFAQATAIGGQFLSAVGPITDDWWRVNYTIAGGAFTFVVAISIL